MITEKTLIPLSMVIVFMSAAFWLSSLYIKTEALGQTVENITHDQKQNEKFMREIIDRLSRIEGYLDKSKK